MVESMQEARNQGVSEGDHKLIVTSTCLCDRVIVGEEY